MISRKSLAIALFCLPLAGCFEKWEVLSVTDLSFPGDCQVARDHFDPAARPEGVPGWTGESGPDDVCATVLVKILESDPTEPLPDGLTLSTTFTQLPASGDALQRSAAYAIADPTTVTRLRVVAFMARGAEAADRARQSTEGYPLEVAGTDIAPIQCTVYPGRGEIDCD
ncbi:hypothetical protein [uncultured Thiohalocapsa sp.]|uniref:hypothetical protein n=1 Tax=uncultured Thiohalocapsa sp. TaxID=768990 RepID=UPI0025F6B61C|nr:hypothetical protein [uncultured Thiohalocapsa sp.]